MDRIPKTASMVLRRRPFASLSVTRRWVHSSSTYSNPTLSLPSLAPSEPAITAFFHATTQTWQYLLHCVQTRRGLIIDPVLDYDPVRGHISTEAADGLLSFAANSGIQIERVLETHAHADHLTAAAYLKQRLGPSVSVGIGANIIKTYAHFQPIYALPDIISTPSNLPFDTLFHDIDTFPLGSISARVLHLPGHTCDHVGYAAGKNVFVGDSVFMPDIGSARTDFPLGSADDLWRSAKRLLDLPDDWRLFVGHDYPETKTPEARPEAAFATVAEHRRHNKHIAESVTLEDFIQAREERNASLGTPGLLHPSIQCNLRAGRLGPRDADGKLYFRTPLRIKGMVDDVLAGIID